MGKGGDQKVSKNTEIRSDSIDDFSKPRTDFYQSMTDEPHVMRRKAILKKYPEISELFGNDVRVVPFVVALVALQLYLAAASENFSWPVYFLVAWGIGGTASHALSLMTHEASHNLIFATRSYNDYFGIFCNLGMGVPSSTLFKRYHMEHHQFQGYEEYDMDVPSTDEGDFFVTPMRKVLFLILQFGFYGLRPSIVRPKVPSNLDIMNTIIILSFDLAVCLYYPNGPHALGYILLSVVLGMGLHPCAGHFISEHYVFPNEESMWPSQYGTKGVFDVPVVHTDKPANDAALIPVAETYSYYGMLNLLCWNVGYHNEHHDFPRVPGWRLPQVRAMAPEFYNHLPQHKSWTWCLIAFITNPGVSPYSRVMRTRQNMAKKTELRNKSKAGVDLSVLTASANNKSD